MAELHLIVPELGMLAAICLVLLFGAFARRGANGSFWLSIASLLAVMAVLTIHRADLIGTGFGRMYVADALAATLKIILLALAVFTLFYTRDYFERRQQGRSEIYVLMLTAVLGMMVLISAGSLLTVYLGLELLSLSLYALVALQRDSALASEAAMKYFVLGALASGMLLYGMSMLYGVTGTLDLAELGQRLPAVRYDTLPVFGLVFVVAGVAFKLGVVPFHMWVPDVYQGAPTPVTLFISSVPKLAALAMALRLLVDGLGSLHGDWQGMLAILALLSMALGNVIAIAQDNLKRMLAYSTISHMGFMLLGLLSANPGGYAAAMFYVVVYAFMSMASFGMLLLIDSANGERDRIADFAGFARTSPWYALLFLIVLFSLAGVPPFAGFWAKWYVIKEAIAAGYLWLALAAVVASVIGAFYYLRIVKVMYFDAPLAEVKPEAGGDLRFVLNVNSLGILALGVLPNALLGLCLVATASL